MRVEEMFLVVQFLPFRDHETVKNIGFGVVMTGRGIRIVGNRYWLWLWLWILTRHWIRFNGGVRVWCSGHPRSTTSLAILECELK